MAELFKVHNYQGGMNTLNFVEENVPDEELVAHVAKAFKTTVGFAEVLIAIVKYKPEIYLRHVVQAITEFQE